MLSAHLPEQNFLRRRQRYLSLSNGASEHFIKFCCGVRRTLTINSHRLRYISAIEHNVGRHGSGELHGRLRQECLNAYWGSAGEETDARPSAVGKSGRTVGKLRARGMRKH